MYDLGSGFSSRKAPWPGLASPYLTSERFRVWGKREMSMIWSVVGAATSDGKLHSYADNRVNRIACISGTLEDRGSSKSDGVH